MPEPTVIVRMKEDGGARPRKAQGLAFACLPHALGRFSLLPFLRETFSMFKSNSLHNCDRAAVLRSREASAKSVFVSSGLDQAGRGARLKSHDTAQDVHVAEVR